MRRSHPSSSRCLFELGDAPAALAFAGGLADVAGRYVRAAAGEDGEAIGPIEADCYRCPCLERRLAQVNSAQECGHDSRIDLIRDNRAKQVSERAAGSCGRGCVEQRVDLALVEMDAAIRPDPGVEQPGGRQGGLEAVTGGRIHRVREIDRAPKWGTAYAGAVAPPRRGLGRLLFAVAQASEYRLGLLALALETFEFLLPARLSPGELGARLLCDRVDRLPHTRRIGVADRRAKASRLERSTRAHPFIERVGKGGHRLLQRFCGCLTRGDGLVYTLALVRHLALAYVACGVKLVELVNCPPHLCLLGFP